MSDRNDDGTGGADREQIIDSEGESAAYLKSVLDREWGSIASEQDG